MINLRTKAEVKMNYLKVILVMVIAATVGLSAQEKKSETLFSGDIEHGGYGAVELKYSQVNDGMGLFVGGRGGWIINSTLSIGGGGYGLVTDHVVDGYNPEDPLIDKAYLRTGYGGLILEYINNSDELVHFTVNALVGAGGAVYTDSWENEIHPGDNEGQDWNNYENSEYFIFEPGITADLNMFTFMRVSLGASYRFISGLDLPNTENADLSGASVNLAFKFGKF